MLRTVKRPLISIMVVILIFSAAILAPSAQAEAATMFTDINYHWAGNAISRWEALGVLQDFAPGSFRPDAPITRAEFFAILVRALGGTEQADISRFTDVDENAWYYEIVAAAHQMKIANGTSESTMAPTANITRQDAATLVARAFGMPNERADFLYRYEDRDYISDYAKNYVSTVTEYGYMTGSYGNFYPRSNLSRAEAVKIVDNLFVYYYRPEAGFDNLTLNGNVLSTRAASVFNSLTVNGDLILGDGVGEGMAELNDCVINGRLVIRGGGSNSVVLSNTSVTDGIVVISPSSRPRVVTTGSTVVQQLTAFSGFILSGTGVHAVEIAAGAFPNAAVTLSGVQLDSLEVGGFAAKIDMTDGGRIAKAHFSGDAEGATFSLGKDSVVDYISTVAPNTTVNGTGRVGDAFINAPGARFTISPGTYTVGVNLTATIAGQAVTGQMLATGNSVARSSSELSVNQDSGHTGGDGLIISSTQGRSSNAVLVTQKVVDEVPLDSVDSRYGYFVGFFIPAPSGNSRDAIPLLTYSSSDGELTAMRDVSLTRKGGVSGLEFFIPVQRDGKLERGRLQETMYIQWSDRVSENLIFHSGWLDLEPLSGSQESRLADEYRQCRFYGLDGERYSGAEALKRLLTSDNPLGLDIKGFAAFSSGDQDGLAALLAEFSNDFGSKEAIQERLDQILAGKGALYAVNNAVTVDQMRNALENSVFAKQLNINVAPNSAYDGLSAAGRERVARQMINGRTKEYASAAAVKTAFDKAVADTKSMEISFLVALNAAKTAAEVQKLIETKANADLLGLDTGMDPYKSYSSTLRLELAQRIKDAAPFYSVDEVKRIIDDFLATTDSGSLKPTDDINITSIKVDPTSITLLLGQTATFSYTVTTPSGLVIDDWDEVTVTSSNTTVAEAMEGVISARAAGTARITVTSVKDTKKSATISVTVKMPVPATSVTLNLKQIEIEEGQISTLLRATMIPANTTDSLTWSMANPAIASVSGGTGGTGVVTGLSAGFTTVTVRTSSNQTANAQVIVVSKEPGVMVNPQTATVGIGQNVQLQAVVSPISLPNRTVRWVSADSAIATVDSFGKVTGVSEGPVEITAISNYDNSLRDTCVVTVDASVRRLTLNTNKIVMFPTGMEQLTAILTPPKTASDVIKWEVRAATPGGPEDIVTVDANGLVKGVPGKTGTIYVFAYLESNSTVMAECEVQVLTGSLRITANPVTMSMEVGASRTPTVTYNPNTVTNKTIIWESENEDIAVVDANGKITAVSTLGLGNAKTKIFGRPQADSTLVLVIDVTVTDIPVSRFSVLPNHIYMDLNDVIYLTDPGIFSIVMLPENATNKQILWTGDNSGRVSVDNMMPTAADPYGPSSLKADKTTYTPKEVMIPNPDGSYTTEIQMIDDPIVLVARAVGAASTVKEVTILVSIYPSDTNQVSNIKIALDRWVYPVGVTNQYMTVHFNVTGRNLLNGDWQLGPQPPNRKLTWSSGSTSNIANVASDNRLLTLSPGTASLMATSQDGGRTDTVTVVVEDYGVSSMSFSGLSTSPGYGKFLQMYVGEEKDVTATISPAEGANAQVVWIPYKWEYDTANPQGHVTGTAFSELPITQPVSLRTGHITAKEPGLFRVTVQPTNPNKIGVLSITRLEQVCNEMGVSFTDYLAKNGIVREGAPGWYTYYSPNEVNLNTAPKAPRVALDPDAQYYLVMPHQVDAGSNEFFVWVTGRKLTDLSVTSPAAGAVLQPGDSITIVADAEPHLNIASATWQYSATVLQKTSVGDGYNPLTGQFTASFQVLNTAADGKYDIELTVITPDESGLISTVTGYPAQIQDGATRSATYSLTVAAASPAPPRSAPARQPETQPAEPTGAGYIDTPVVNNTVDVPPADTQPVNTPTPAPVTTTSSISLELSTGTRSPLLSLAAKNEGLGLITAYSSSNPAVAVVDSAGIVTGVAPGTAAITVSGNGRAVSADVSVNYAGTAATESKALKLRSAAVVMAGRSITLSPMLTAGDYDMSALTWSSSKPDIATVDGNGVVSGLKAGKSVITVSLPGTKFRATCTVSVSAALKIPVTGLTLNNSSLTLEAGRAATLKATVGPSNATAKGVSWYSSNPAVAVVDAAGKVSGVGEGSVTIAAVTDDGGYVASCAVTVTPKPIRVTGVKLSNTALSMTVGEEFQLTYTILPENANNQAVTWVSSNKNVVAVEDGKLTALKKGTVTITIVSADGQKKATCRVTVK